MLVDSHCHLNYLSDIQEKLLLAREAGVEGFLCIGVNAHEFPQIKSLADAHSDIWMTAGVHPEGVGESSGLEWLERALRNDGVVGVGETGLDYSQLDGDMQNVITLQNKSFSRHLELAGAYDLPVIIHSREAQADTLQRMSEYPGTQGVMHCFTESWEMAESALSMGYYISISGIVTFKNAKQVKEVAKRVPLERLLVETDCPWLAPVPYRGMKNQPAFVCDTARYIAELRNMSYAALCEVTTANFYRLFSKTKNG